MYIDKRRGVASDLDFIPLMEESQNSFSSSLFAKYFNKSIKESVECEQVVANNIDIKNKLVEVYGKDANSVTVIPPPIDGKFFPKNKDSNSFIVGSISYLTKRKRFDILIKSFLEANIPNSQLWIGGKGPDLENLKKLANGDKRIKFLGFVSDESLNDFYNCLDVFVFPTLVEGYGMPMVEAMACGKPVVTLDDAIIPSDIKNRTIVVSKEGLSDLLLSESFDFDKNGNISFYNQHSVDNISSKLLKVYKTI
jgi:glycosyltransferase involved in cell wall biosynthesis